MCATPPAPPYQVIGRPGPGLATITDRRTGATVLWARTLASGPGEELGPPVAQSTHSDAARPL